MELSSVKNRAELQRNESNTGPASTWLKFSKIEGQEIYGSTQDSITDNSKSMPPDLVTIGRLSKGDVPHAANTDDGNVTADLLVSKTKMMRDDDSKYETLHIAASFGDETAVQLLLDMGADIEARDIRRWTPLHKAASSGHERVVELLLDRSADIEAKDIIEWTPLHITAYGGHKTVVELLLDMGADIEARDSRGRTPLHEAAYGGHVTVVQLLLNRNADTMAKRLDGMTPLHAARSMGRWEVVQMLRDRGAQITVMVRQV